MKTKPQIAKCRWCNSLFEFTEDAKPEWPGQCWLCSEKTEARWREIEATRVRELKPFSPLG